jgi:lysophospholipase L1-like esterase
MNFSKLSLSITIIIIISLSAGSPKKQILMIGDSISILYGPYLKEYLQDKFEYRVKGNVKDAIVNLDNPNGSNAGNSRMILEYFKHYNETGMKLNVDIILFNCGLHDIKTDPVTNEKAVSIDEYKSNLDSLYQIIKHLNKKLIWINTTPVNDSIHNSKPVGFYRYNDDVIKYNSASDVIFSAHGIPIIDLYTFSKSFPSEAYSDHVHYKPEYSKLQAKFISDFLLNTKFTE